MTTDATRTTPTEFFSPVANERVSQVIVDQIKALLRDGKLVPGDRLPSERQLCEQFGVSRVTVREALRILEAGGLVDIRVGARGGAYFTSPTPERLGQGLADLLQLSPLTASDVTEARMVFELNILPLAVERATDADIADLRSLVKEAQDALKHDAYTMDMSAAFHNRLASCTHNPAIEMLVQSFHGPLLMSLNEARVNAPLMGRRGTTEHGKLVEALASRDADAAMKVMLTHLKRTASRVGTADA